MLNRKDYTEEERDEIASAARDISESRAFRMVLENLQATYVQELVAATVGSLTAQDAHASMRVLERVRNDLSNLRVFNKK